MNQRSWLIDANVLIASSDQSEPAFRMARGFIEAARDGRQLILVPAIGRLEIVLALARRSRDGREAVRSCAELLDWAQATIVAMEAHHLKLAETLGARFFLRSLDAIYAAVALDLGATLVSLDNELIRRAGAVAPDPGLLAAG